MASTLTRLVPTDDSGDDVSGTSWNASYLVSLYDSIENTFNLSTTYVPTWTGAGGNPAIVNGTLTGRYFQIGKWVQFQITITMGSSTTYGSGAYTFGLPVSAANIGTQLTNAYLLDSGTSHYRAVGLVIAGSATLQVVGTDVSTFVGATGPFTFAVNDEIIITGGYVAA